MSESCPKCGSQKLHPDDRYFVCGADSHGQYSNPASCYEAALAAATKQIEEFRGAIHYFSDSDNRGTLWKEIEAMDGSQLASYLIVESDKQESYIDLICQEKAAATKRADHYEKACSRTEFELQEILGKALGYPRFCDMPPINPDDPADAADQSKNEHYFVGEHVAATLASELASKYAAATKRAEEAEAKLAQSTNYVADDDTYPTCVWFANGRVVSVNAEGVLEIRFGKQLEMCDDR